MTVGSVVNLVMDVGGQSTVWCTLFKVSMSRCDEDQLHEEAAGMRQRLKYIT